MPSVVHVKLKHFFVAVEELEHHAVLLFFKTFVDMITHQVNKRIRQLAIYVLVDRSKFASVRNTVTVLRELY